MAKSVQRFGGSFAPPIDSSKLSSYRSTINAQATGAAQDSVPFRVKDQLLGLCNMVEAFQQTPASANASKPHPSGTGTITFLEEAEIQRIWDLVPFDWELKALQAELDKLDSKDPLRNPAFHLLWFAIELTNDREPLTNDRL
jgi:hypothetical protein